MNKVGLCIKYQNRNYGSMLQTFAFTKFLDELPLDYELIRYKKKRSIIEVIKSLPRFLNVIFINDRIETLKKFFGLKFHKVFAKNNEVRDRLFNDYCEREFTKLSPVYYGYSELIKSSSNYQIILSGSDQIWSPAALGSNFYNLMFCKEMVKKVSYASSFGVSYIPWYQKKRTIKYLSEMDCISVREESGARIIKNLINRDVDVVCDPVLLLSKAKWDSVIVNKNIIEEKYVFAYFLGNTKEYREKVTEFAKERGLKIVTLRHLDQYVKADEEFGDYAPYDIGPEEFLNLIRNAEYVFTDSFHGSCFSIINHKKFLTFNRYSNKSKVSKNSRIDTLMANIGINRRYTGAIEDVLTDINYSMVDQKLNDLIVFSKKYLCNALEVDYDSNN